MQKNKIAFFGLGTMGTGMAHRLLDASFPVTVFSRTPEKAAAFVRKGAQAAKSAREAAKDADLLIAMLSDDDASTAVWLGEQGALAGVQPGAICLDCSTLTVPFVHKLAEATHARHAHFLDAPVTGTKPHAEKGELTFLIGGDAASLEKARPALAAMSKEILHLGPVGSGAVLKLINNFVCGVQATALAEALALMDRAGLNIEQSLPVLLNGAPGSPLSKTLATRHATHDPTIYFQLHLMAKDLSYAIQAAQHFNHLDLKTAHAALHRFKEAAAAGFSERDLSAIIEYLRQSK